MNLINARPRFGLEGDTIFDYATSRYTPISDGFMTTPEGRWDLFALADCIRRGGFIETAMVREGTTGHSDEVLEANRQFLAGPLDPVTGLSVPAAPLAPPPRDDRNMTAGQIAGDAPMQFPGPAAVPGGGGASPGGKPGPSPVTQPNPAPARPARLQARLGDAPVTGKTEAQIKEQQARDASNKTLAGTVASREAKPLPLTHPDSQRGMEPPKPPLK